MSFQISWQLEGEQQLLRNLRIKADRVKDWTPAFKKVSEELKNTFANDVFQSRGGAIGEKWPKLSPQYLAAKTRAGYPEQPLVRTGAMQKSFKTLFKADMAAVWNTAAYFKYHQSKLPRNRLPRRAMMKIYHQQREVIQKAFQEEYIKIFK
jgi:phage gpG-like protein